MTLEQLINTINTTNTLTDKDFKALADKWFRNYHEKYYGNDLERGKYKFQLISKLLGYDKLATDEFYKTNKKILHLIARNCIPYQKLMRAFSDRAMNEGFRYFEIYCK